MSRGTTHANIYYEVVGIVDTKRETDKAILVKIHSLHGHLLNGSHASHWFPKSQVHDLEYGTHGTETEPLDSFQASEWILTQKGFGTDLEQVGRAIVRKDTLAVQQARGIDDMSSDYDGLDDDIPF